MKSATVDERQAPCRSLPKGLIMDFHPIGSLAMHNPQLSLIAEWWGRNLLLGASIKPFNDVTGSLVLR